MGEDVQHLLCTKTEANLDKIRFDGSSKQFTYSIYISAMREAWEDLGPWDVYSDERKVQKLLSSFQVKALSHLVPPSMPVLILEPVLIHQSHSLLLNWLISR